jgi:hypothetical protein
LNASRQSDDRLLLEQMVYGSFADRPGGYEVRFQTPGLNETVTSLVVRHCDNWGEMLDDRFDRALMTLPLHSHDTGGSGSLVMVDQISHLGIDSSGRRGALMHHVLILTPDEYQAVGADPFILADSGALRIGWTGEPMAGPAEIPAPAVAEIAAGVFAAAETAHLRAALIMTYKLLGRRKVLFWIEERTAEFDQIIRLCWLLLPRDHRFRTRMSTFAFLNRNDFDLAAIYSDLTPVGYRKLVEQGREDYLEQLLPAGPASYMATLLDALRNGDWGRATELADAGIPDG